MGAAEAHKGQEKKGFLWLVALALGAVIACGAVYWVWVFGDAVRNDASPRPLACDWLSVIS